MTRALPSVLVPYVDACPMLGHKRIDTAPKLTASGCALLGLPVAGGGETLGKIVTRGPWHILVSYAAIVKVDTVDGVRFYPRRVAQSSETLNPSLRVRVAGKRGPCFNSSQLFTLPDGTLHDCATLVCSVSHPARGSLGRLSHVR
jgi:hypothetical protein